MRRFLAALLAVGCAAPPATTEPVLPALSDYRTRDLRDEVVYEVMVDRFANGEPEPATLPVRPVPDDLARIQGGDWSGLTARLPYLRDLGVSALWISPIFENVARFGDEDGYHGYWASDMTQLNPYFGSLEQLQELVDQAHALELKVFVDVAPNHFGQVFSYDLDHDGAASADEQQPPFRVEGPYAAPLLFQRNPALFHGVAAPGDDRSGPSSKLVRVPLVDTDFHRRGAIASFVDERQVLFGDFPKALRDLATESDDVVTGLVDTLAEWVRLTDVDGFRLDAVPHAPAEFWAALCSGLRQRLHQLGHDRFFLFGEVFRSDPRDLAQYTGPGGMDAPLDFPFWTRVIGGYVLGGLSALSAVPTLTDAQGLFQGAAQAGGVGLDAWQARLVFADNHDTGRILGKLPDPLAVEIAMTLVFTVDALPVVYYGTEQGFDGVTQHAAREPMWWAGYTERYPLFERLRQLSFLRRTHPALKYGDLEVRYASAATSQSEALDAGLLAYERVAPGDRVLVAIGASATRTARARVPSGFAAGTALRDELGSAHRAYRVESDGSVDLSVEPRTALVLAQAAR